MRVAKRIAETNGCVALATGDSLGQVASQTIDSMTTIQSIVDPMLIVRPLLAFCKDEILARARAIGTHEFSILPGGDCCAHMLPKHVAVKPKIQDAEKGEERLGVKAIVEAAMQAARSSTLTSPGTRTKRQREPPALLLSRNDDRNAEWAQQSLKSCGTAIDTSCGSPWIRLHRAVWRTDLIGRVLPISGFLIPVLSPTLGNQRHRKRVTGHEDIAHRHEKVTAP
jgi:hypothetical protein